MVFDDIGHIKARTKWVTFCRWYIFKYILLKGIMFLYINPDYVGFVQRLSVVVKQEYFWFRWTLVKMISVFFLVSNWFQITRSIVTCWPLLGNGDTYQLLIIKIILNTLGPRQDGCHIAKWHFQMHLLEVKLLIFISLQHFAQGLIYDIYEFMKTF